MMMKVMILRMRMIKILKQSLSENGEKQNAPRGGGDGGDEPSSNPGSENVGPRGQ